MAAVDTTETIEEQGGGGPQAGKASAPTSVNDLGQQVAQSPPSSQWHLSQEGPLSQGVAQYAQIPLNNGKIQGLMPHVPEFQHGQHQGGVNEAEARKVVVLGVPWQTEDTTLHAHFSQYGSVEEAQIMRERYTGKSRGFGFVTFASSADAQHAIAAEHVIDGRRCEAKLALPEGKVGSARTTRIFVARIPSSVTDPQFRSYFEQFGTVQDAYMPKDPSKQGHRGIGFVTYASAESVERVMAGTHVLNGNEVALDRATPKERAQGATLPGRLSMSQPNLHMLAAGGSAHGGNAFPFMRMGGAPLGPPRYDGRQFVGGLGNRQMSHPALSSGAAPFGSPPQSKVASTGHLTGGMAYNTSGANLQALAQAQAQAQAALRHHLSSNSLSSLDGSAPTPQQQQQLINLINANVAVANQQGFPVGGNGNNGGVPQGGPPPQPTGLPHSGSSGHFSASGASSSNDLAALMSPPQQEHHAQHHVQHAQQLAAAAGWVGPQPPRGPPMPAPAMGPPSARAGPRIFVGKLNRETSDHDVKDYFSRFGYVLDVYLPRDKTNKREHRGFGFVTFETEASIQRVVSHGPHHIKGSVIAIDSAVPRQEEMVMTIDPSTAGAAGAHPQQTQHSAPVPVPGRSPSQAEALHAFEGLNLGDGGGGSSAPEGGSLHSY